MDPDFSSATVMYGTCVSSPLDLPGWMPRLADSRGDLVGLLLWCPLVVRLAYRFRVPRPCRPFCHHASRGAALGRRALLASRRIQPPIWWSSSPGTRAACEERPDGNPLRDAPPGPHRDLL